MGKDLDKTYDPHSFEDRLYAFLQEKGTFPLSSTMTKSLQHHDAAAEHHGSAASGPCSG